MRTFVVVIVFAFAPSVLVSAAPVLLKEVQVTQSHVYIHRDSPLPDTVTFSVELGPVAWRQALGPESVGMTFSAPQSTVEMFASRWMDIQNYDVAYAASGTGLVVSGGSLRVEIDPSLRAVPLVGIERTIDAITLDELDIGRRFLHGGTQTLRFYGELVPEPSALLMLISAFIAAPRFRRG